ncbi:MAG: hypothetical protein HY298_16935 [Verrucomicrobia bacterium]|nr:hypothetical protein [Verrucomicrobiota bacterium]
MAHTFTETTGIMQAVVAYMQDANNTAALAAKNFDVGPHLTRLQTKLASMSQLNTEQEQLKVNLGNKTKALDAASTDGYTDTSGVIDAMMGMLGKSSIEAKNLQTIRSRIRQGGGPTPPGPTPP